MTIGVLVRAAAMAAVMGVAGCNGLYLGDSPRPDVPKETGPLTVPPPGVRAGTDP